MQCPQCHQPNDHNARFCVQCGARVRTSACAACGGKLPAPARFCPECGMAVVASVAPTPPTPPLEHDRVDALLTARDPDGLERDPDGLEEDAPSPGDAELVERVRDERQRTRTRRSSVVLAGVALLVLIAALALARRTSPPVTEVSTPPPGETAATARVAPPTVASSERPGGMLSQRTPATAAPATAAPAPAAPAPAAPAPAAPKIDAATPAPARTVTPPQSSAALELPEPAAMPRAAAPEVRVEVAQKPVDGAVDYTVRVSRPDGAPVSDADVRLRGIMTDGTLVEALLEPAGEPGVYQSFLTFSARGPRALTLRVARADGVVEVPVAAPSTGGKPAKP